MTRKSSQWSGLITTGIVLAVLASVVFVFADKVGWFREPPLKLEMKGNSATVHLETPDENQTPVSHVRIKDDSTGDVIYEVVADGQTPLVFNFELSVGQNTTQVVSFKRNAYRVVAPQGIRTFTLQRGVKYRLTVWGDSWTSTSKSFEF
jgi:hypothetical protein